MAFVLKLGMSSKEVSRLQEILIEKNFLDTSIQGKNTHDGVFGKITEDAVRKFQRANELSVDGVVGRFTAEALGISPPQPTRLPEKNGFLLTTSQQKRLAAIIDGIVPTGPLDIFDDQLIVWAVEKLDSTVAELLPKNILDKAQDITTGIDSGNFSAIINRLTAAINSRINLPLLSEDSEGKVIGFFIKLIAEALRTGRDIDTAFKALALR